MSCSLGMWWILQYILASDRLSASMGILKLCISSVAGSFTRMVARYIIKAGCVMLVEMKERRTLLLSKLFSDCHPGYRYEGASV